MTKSVTLSRSKRVLRGLKSLFCCFCVGKRKLTDDSSNSSPVRKGHLATPTLSKVVEPVSKVSEMGGYRVSHSGTNHIATSSYEEMSGHGNDIYQNQIGVPWTNELSGNYEPGTTNDNDFSVPLFGLDMSKCRIIKSHNLKFKECVGKGKHVGLVYRGQLFCKTVFTKRENEVAIKTLKGSYHPSLVKELLKESCILSKFKHRNLLSLIGVCVDGGLVPFIVMPFMTNGNLLDFLDKESEHLSVVPFKTTGELTMKVENKLLEMCLQVAKGMKYLTNKRMVHRNLAARNCMIDSHLVIKLFNFGFCEKLEPSKNYLKHTEKDVKFSLKWMAPEIFVDNLFSEKTDVWAYGVTCWEIFSCGKIPYSQVAEKELLPMLRSGYRMVKPYNEACSDKLYQDLQMTCWTEDPAKRPHFSSIVHQIKHFICDRSRNSASTVRRADDIVVIPALDDESASPPQVGHCPPWYSREHSHYKNTLPRNIPTSACLMPNFRFRRYY